MLLIAQTSFPRSSIREAAIAFAKLPKLPASVRRQGPFFHFDEAGNVSAITIYVFNHEEITDNEIKFIKKRYDLFADVPDFTYSINKWMNMEEALNIVKSMKIT